MSLIQLLKFKEMETELYETSHFIMLHFQTEVFETDVAIAYGLTHHL